MSIKVKQSISKEENYATVIKIEVKNNDQSGISDLLNEEKLSLKRGDIVSTYVHGSSEISYIFDGKSFIEIVRRVCQRFENPRLFPTCMPQGFPVIEEFPIHYWDKHDRGICLNFDVEKYSSEIVKNLSSTKEFGKFMVRGILEYKYMWSQFTFDNKTKFYQGSDVSQILIEDLNKIVEEYYREIYYLIFLFRPESTITEESFKKLLNDQEFRSKLKFGAGLLNQPNHGKSVDLKEYIMYVNLAHTSNL